MSKHSPALGSLFDVGQLGPDAQRAHAARLLVSGYDLESAAVLSRLPLEDARAIADELEESAP